MKVIGLISGTSVDGIDAAFVEISGATDDLKVDLIASKTYPYSAELRSQILAVCGGAALSMPEFAALDDAIAQSFAHAALSIQVGHPTADLIGSHGQTVYHRPPATHLGYSLQLGRGVLIADLTQITTISNFRAGDIAAWGQGAPLVSPVDVCLLSHNTHDRCVQNIGGIGNVTYLPARSRSSARTMGWDTGPGNALLDLAIHQLTQGEKTFDPEGAWAAQGNPCLPLVQQWLQQDFFHQPPPKSTGRELFGVEYLQQCFVEAEPYHLEPADFLATLTELTAASIAQSYRDFLPHLPDQVLLCGGGNHNLYLRQRLQANLNTTEVRTTNEMGLNADFKEAIAFAILGYWRHQNIPSNLPDVTGASRKVVLGEIHMVDAQAK
ncbi:MAG: anhydro-N-acetylmuramic acid kinase [Timaviella obliquedivisa GSE-PSE-MK23-08B]|jgi:anhydro-N-acetylmuramic acid kinase|nr:anhydro-N-acetylmuramic acid kinase [Timaviella obliquedivisa GSE-PSE-MK23-08B]